MVRTKANNAAVRKAVAAKAPRKHLGAGTRHVSSVVSPSSSKRGKKGSGNPVRAWPTPDWQKGIATFLSVKDGSSSSKVKSQSTTNNSSSSNKENVGLNGTCSSSTTPEDGEDIKQQQVLTTSDGEELEEEGSSEEEEEEEEEEDLISEEEEESEIDEKDTATSKIASLSNDLVSAGEESD